MLYLSVIRVPRPCPYMLGSSRSNLSFRMSKYGLLTLYTLAESNTPDHHAMLRNNKFYQRGFLRMNTLKLEIVCLRDHLIMLPSLTKQYKMHKRINITCNS